MDATDPQHLLDLIHGCWTTQALCAAVELGVVDALVPGPLDARALADLLDTDKDGLVRLLQALVSLGICALERNATFGLTDTGRLLSNDHPASLGAWALLVGRQLWVPWHGLAESVRTGLGHHARTGTDRFEVLGTVPSDAVTFHSAMAGLTSMVVSSVAEVAADWLTGPGCIVDVGAGQGLLLATLLKRNPRRVGVAFDQAHAREGAQRTFKHAGLEERAAFISGSFFDSVPAGDVLLLKSVLHDWDDARCKTILERCATAMKMGAVLLVVERVLPNVLNDALDDRRICRSDLNMLVGPGGRERTQAEFASLFQCSGLETSAIQSLAGGFSLLVVKAGRIRTPTCEFASATPSYLAAT
ncbi:methyltransferase [Rhizobacter sp. Root404]|uniref:methyltransferase n=1 Tax=Rhizobacter sp. Root404 TaxID=1736528 RepID=UPI0006F7956B|nr:methyltransferase [Rhizobacter sp. Root404]KQW38523.1 hypothetical protein ASC76_10980 [Rhizobacter sp. Root404]